MLRNLLLSLVMSLAAIAHGQHHTYIIDFEEFDEDVAITDQYSSLGVWFSTVNNSGKPPIIVREGNPTRAFATSGQNDAPMASGDAGLADPILNNDYAKPSSIAMVFSPPVKSVQIYAIDLDGTDSLTLRAYYNGVEVNASTVTSTTTGAGDGKSVPVIVEAASIDRVVVEPRSDAATIGWAMDFLVFKRGCQVEVCPPALVRVSQESSPNANDFDGHILGYTGYFLTGTNSQSIYAYNVPDESSYNGPLFQPVKNRSHILLATTTDAQVLGHGVSVLVIHDEPYSNANGGGRAEMKLQATGDCTYNKLSVKDDPTSKDASDVYSGNDGSCEFTAKNVYTYENTDGFAVSGLDVDGSVYLSFTNVDGNANNKAIDNLDSWAVHSPDGSTISLALEEGRRVKLDLVPPCIADFDRSGFVDLDDYIFFVTVFMDGFDAADVDRSGFVDTDDFTFFILAFEAGC